MSLNRITIEDFEQAIELMDDKLEGDINRGNAWLRLHGIRDKFKSLLENTRKVRELEQQAKDGDPTVSAVEVDDAQAMSDTGEQYMLLAVPARLPEAGHHRLCCLQVGLTTAIHKVTGIPRSLLANKMFAHVTLTALKAAYMEGGGPTLDPDGS